VTWTKLGDEFADECWQLSDDAFRTHAEGLIWSNRKHLDGKLDKGEIHRWAKHPEAVTDLVDVGFWEDRNGHFQIIHHQEFQRTAAEWLHQSEVNRANRAKRKPKGRSSNDSSNGSSNESLNSSSNDSSQSDDSSNGSYNETVWSGLVSTGLGTEPNYVSGNDEKVEDYFEPPAVDSDGFPLDCR